MPELIKNRWYLLNGKRIKFVSCFNRKGVWYRFRDETGAPLKFSYLDLDGIKEAA